MKKEIMQIIKSIHSISKKLESRQKISLILALLFMIVAGLLVNVPALLLGEMVDEMTAVSDPNNTKIIWFLAILLSVIIIKEIFNVSRRYLVEDSCTKVEKQLRILTVEHLLKLDFNYFENEMSGAINGRINRSLEGSIRLLKLCYLDFLPMLFSTIFAIVIVFLKLKLIGLIMLVFLPVTFFIVLHQLQSQKGIRINLLRGKEKIDGTVVELLGNIESVRAINSEKYEVKYVEKISEKLRKIEIKHHIWMAGYDALKSIMEGIFYIIVIGLAIYFALKNFISIGEILTYSILFTNVTNPLREIHRIIDEAHESSIRVQDLSTILNMSIDQSFLSNFRTLELNGDYPIKIRQLSFQYPSSQQYCIFRPQVATCSGESCHPFRFNVATYSGLILPPGF